MAMTLTQNEEGLARILGKLPGIASFFLIVLIAWSLAGLTWKLLTPAQNPAAFKPATTRATAAGPKATTNFGPSIAGLHLFGNAVQKQAPKAVAAAAPETKLNLTLRGVFATGDDTALAIIAAGGNKEQFYKVGQSVSGGAKLNAVYADHVILERNARMETLKLPKAETTGGRGAGLTRTQPAATNNAAAATPAANTARNLGRLRSQILNNPQQLAKMVEAKPVMENDQFKGFQLNPRRNKQLFAQLGLEAGDIITGVNGIPLDRPENGLSALQNLVDATEITVTLLRGGNEVTLQQTIGQ